MATGAYDANGIWQYGEDDNIALFSDLLNLATESTSDAFTDDRARLATLEAGSLSGLIPISPVSIVVATGTASVNTLGVVSFTGATTISLNDVFTSEYANYKVIFTGVISANENLRFRLRTTSDAATNYTNTYLETNGSSVFAATASGETSGRLAYIGTSPNGVIAEFFGPALAQNTAYNSSAAQSTSNGIDFKAGKHTTAVAYSGISVFPQGAQTLTGKIQVFGYND